MKIAVLNNSGNVGKTTLCVNLLAPRIKDVQIIRIESINDDNNTQGEKLISKQFIDIMNRVMTLDDVILDIGSSNIEDFYKQLQTHEGSIEDIDYFIIPVVPNLKQQRDSISTVSTLLDLEVKPEQIKIILNNFEDDDDVQKIFSYLIENNIFKSLGVDIKSLPRIPLTSLFFNLQNIGITFNEIIKDERDYKALIKNSTNQKDKEYYATLRSIKRLATTFNKILDSAFHDLNLKA